MRITPQVLGIVSGVLVMRRRHIQDQLRRMFVDGDDNGDGCVLPTRPLDAKPFTLPPL